MDTLETITIHTHLEDELEFIRFLLEEKNACIITSKIGISGPNQLSLADIMNIRQSKSRDRTLLIWYSSCLRPLCWSPFTSWYDAKWEPIEPSFGKPRTPSTKSPWGRITSVENYCDLHTSFRSRAITEDLFSHGHISRGLSPVVELELPYDDHDFLSLTVDFVERLAHDVWLTWNQVSKTWEHINIAPENIYDSIQEQPSDFISWQKDIFNWIQIHWRNWIIPRFTYRLGFKSSYITKAAQSLANLLIRPVIGIDPQPPVVSPRDDENNK